MTPAKLIAIVLTIVISLGTLPLHAADEVVAQPLQMGGYRIIVRDQFGNPHDESYYIEQATGSAVQGFKGETELGKAFGQFPVGDVNVTVGGQTQTVYVHPLVMVTAEFEVEVPFPGPEWLKVHYRGQGPDGTQIFGLYSDYKLLYPGRWAVTIFNNGEQLCYCSVLSMMKENAHVVVLQPGEQILHLEARNFDTGDTFAFDKLVEVEAPAAVSYQTTLVSADTASVAFWIDDDMQFPQGSVCKFTVQATQAVLETECPLSEDEALHMVLPEGENALKIEAWNYAEQISAEFQLVVPVEFFHTALPLAIRSS